MEGIQFFHSCKHAADAAQESQGMEAILAAERAARMERGMAELVDLQNEDTNQSGGLQNSNVSEGAGDIESKSSTSGRGPAAVMIAQLCGLLPQDGNTLWEVTENQGRHATGKDEQIFLSIEAQTEHLYRLFKVFANYLVALSEVQHS